MMSSEPSCSFDKQEVLESDILAEHEVRGMGRILRAYSRHVSVGRVMQVLVCLVLLSLIFADSSILVWALIPGVLTVAVLLIWEKRQRGVWSNRLVEVIEDAEFPLTSLSLHLRKNAIAGADKLVTGTTSRIDKTGEFIGVLDDRLLLCRDAILNAPGK